MKDNVKTILIGLTVFPMAVLFFFVYAYAVSFLDPILTIIIGGGFVIGVGAILFKLLSNLKDFIISIFKENKEVDEKGFKKHF